MYDPSSWPEPAAFLQELDTLTSPARAARRADRRDPYFGRPWIWFGSVCARWPGHDSDRYLGPFNRRTADTVLVVGTRNDPATRYQDAVSTSRLLGRGRLLTVAGWGHTSLFLSSCADAYLIPPTLAQAQRD
jgi:hypothetical protein